MGKRIMVHSLPDRKNDFRIWVDKVRSQKTYLKEPEQPLIKSVYIHRSMSNSDKNPRNWNNIQYNSKNKYLNKIQLMEDIRERKFESKKVTFIYTPRYGYPTISGSK